jgi:alcohol dehydrogenase (cytochrome c)
MGTKDLIETKTRFLTERRDRRRRERTFAIRVALVLAVVVMGATVAGVFYWISLSKTNQPRPLTISEKITWRIRVFARKATGGIPELSLSELLQMTSHQSGFGLEKLVRGLSVDGSVKNGYDTEADLQSASRIFNERCVMCHGKDGAGGDIGPPLNHIGFRHGDSDLAIYKVIRDGVPNTDMRASSISMAQRWQLVGYVRQLQADGVGSSAGKPALDIAVSSERILSAGSKTDEWLTYSGSLDGHRYTPLNQITPANVSQLRIRWVRQLDTTLPSIEATPIVVGGVIFTTEPPSDTIAVDAINARSGDVIWRYARNVSADARACCGRVNRGVAVLDNHIYLASMDGYLVCINANTGQMVWETQIADPSHGYSLSVAPLIVNRSVVVGVAGAEYAIRGFLAAYDPETGKKQWQFDTIPGPGEPGHETWSGDTWRTGGGSTWVTGSYDPALDLLYWGVGNPAPGFSGDDRVGDNLYTDSVIALHASTGKLAWHFQFTPHDIYDWDSAQTPILANISINGKNRKVICWANRNGFYYVLDRVTGEFLVGVPFVEQNWTKGLDSAGRPIPAAADEVSSTWRLVRPANGGATIFQNTAIDQQRGLIFVPATEGVAMARKSIDISPEVGEFFVGSGGAFVTSAPTVSVVRALDAATGTKKWEYFSPVRLQDPTQGGASLSYGGLLATGGGLVFGASGGSVFALDSATGHEVWRVFLGGVTRAAPISFSIDGRQVVAVSVGRGLFLFGL